MSDIFEEEETLLADNSSTDLDLSITADLDLLEQAKKAYSEKDYTNALSFVNKFLETSNSSIDEALYLKGQILEKPFEQRNIRDALECYKLVISAYPQSDLWDKCDERIKYIQRFYFNIR
jgi:outer membrane protein assembly factor BamD (BamD/ComL family)